MSYALRLDWLFYEDLSEALKNRRNAVVIQAREAQIVPGKSSKNRRERQQWWLRSAAVQAYSVHRRPSVQRLAGFSGFQGTASLEGQDCNA